MATSVYTDFKVYNEEFQAGMYEKVAQMIDAFNGASRNCIRLVQKELLGHYEKEAFFKRPSDLITRRDISSTSDATAVKLEQDENISVKLNRKFVVETTRDALAKIGFDYREFSFMLGGMVGEEKLKNYLHAGLMAAEAAFETSTTFYYDATGETTKTMTHTHLANGLKKMGDHAPNILAWAMYSTPYFDLMIQNFSDKIDTVASATIMEGANPTLGRPVIVTDDTALYDANGSATDTYNTLGLVEDGVVVTESEQGDVVYDVVTGKENIVYRVQGEHAFNVAIKGFQWDTTNGGINPNDSTVATASNWDQAATDMKHCAGVRIVTQ